MDRLRLILVSGLPGSGKSFFAKKLAEKIGASYLNSDRIRATLRLRGKYSPSDKLKVYQEMLEQTKYLLHERQSVVVDATFHRAAMRDLFLHLAEEKSISVFCFEVWATRDLIQKRLSQKRPDSEADFNVHEMLKRDFEDWTTPRLRLQSDQENSSTLLNEAMEYLEEENV